MICTWCSRCWRSPIILPSSSGALRTDSILPLPARKAGGGREDAALLSLHSAHPHQHEAVVSNLHILFACRSNRTNRCHLGANVTSDPGCIDTDTAPSSHQRRTRCPTTAPMNAMMAQAAVYQIATNAVPSLTQASV